MLQDCAEWPADFLSEDIYQHTYAHVLLSHMWFFITYLSHVKNNKQKLHFKETVYSSWIPAKKIRIMLMTQLSKTKI